MKIIKELWLILRKWIYIENKYWEVKSISHIFSSKHCLKNIHQKLTKGSEKRRKTSDIRIEELRIIAKLSKNTLKIMQNYWKIH